MGGRGKGRGGERRRGKGEGKETVAPQRDGLDPPVRDTGQNCYFSHPNRVQRPCRKVPVRMDELM